MKEIVDSSKVIRCPALILLDERDKAIENSTCSAYRDSVQENSREVRQKLSEFAGDCPGLTEAFEPGQELPQYNKPEGQAVAKLCPAYKAMKEQTT
jgi:hypothetical protein